MSATAKASANDNALVLEWPAELRDQVAAGVAGARFQPVDFAELPPAPPAPPDPPIVTPGTDEFRRAQRAHHEEMANRFRPGMASALPARLAPHDAGAIACSCAYCFGPCSCRPCNRLRARVKRGGR